MRPTLVELDGQSVGIDANGNIVMRIPFKDFGCLGEERISFTENGKQGIADFDGTIICPPKFDRVFRYVGELAQVEVDGKSGYVNREGEVVIPCLFYNAWPFSCGLAAVQETMMSPWGFIRPDGEYQISPRFRSVKIFNEELGAVRVESGWGFLDKQGEFVIEPKFALVNSFHEGLSAVTRSLKTLKYGFIDQTGEYQLKPAYYGPDMKFSEGLAAVYGKAGFGFIDRSGDLKIAHQFYNSNHFSEGLCCVCVKRAKKEGWGFINHSGEMVIKPEFKIASNFRNGVAMVEAKDGWGYMNKAGEYVWRTTEPR